MESDHAQLDRIEVLSRRYGSSFGTVRRAIHHLVHLGLCVKTGPRTFVVRRDRSQPLPATIQTSGNAYETFAAGIREKILSGEYPTGMPLPKTDYFVLTYNVSPQTVGRAMRLLHGEKIIYKQGKKWIAGTPGSLLTSEDRHVFEASYTTDQAVVLVIVKNPNLYASMCGTEFYLSFTKPFFRELMLNGMETIVCFTEKIDPCYDFVSGVAKIASDVEGRGRRYRGAIVMGSDAAYSTALLKKLLDGKQPVVWFDVKDQSRRPEHRSLYSYRNLIVCRLNRTVLVNKALAHLHASGHRRIGIPDARPTAANEYEHAWMSRRISAS